MEMTDIIRWESEIRRLMPRHFWRDRKYESRELLGLLRFYYDHVFPFEEFCTWLCYGYFDDLHLREFAFRFLSKRFMRYTSFDYHTQMQSEMFNTSPIKFDVGALYNIRPVAGDRTKLNRHPLERELTFDIDLSDYNEVRTCCKESSVCPKCWKYMAVACKILDSSFREDFGWRHILWVFSGRRGIHGWVCDENARAMTEIERKHFLAFYNLRPQGTSTEIPLDLGNSEFIHHQIARSYEIAAEHFVTICMNEQNVLRNPDGVKQFASLLPIGSCREKVIELFGECSTSLEKWNKFCLYWDNEERDRTSLWLSRPHLIKEIVLYYLYPRIDEAVTLGMNHLLKSPFSFHPESLLLSLPFDPQEVDKFFISEVPNLRWITEFHRKDNGLETDSQSPQMRRFLSSLRIFKIFVRSFGFDRRATPMETS